MEFLELLDLPNTTELSYKKSHYRKENKKAEIKQYKRIKVEDSNNDYFIRVLKKVKQSVSTIITAEEKKEYRKNKNRLALQLDKCSSLVDELRASEQSDMRVNGVKRKYFCLNLDIMKLSQMTLI